MFLVKIVGSKMAYTFISCEIEARLAYMRTCLKKPKTKTQNNSNMFSPGLGSWKSEIKVDSELYPLRCQGEKACQAPGLLATPGIMQLLRSGLCFGSYGPFLCVCFLFSFRDAAICIPLDLKPTQILQHYFT